MSETQNDTGAQRSIQQYRHAARDAAANLSYAVGDPLKAVRKSLKKVTGADISNQTSNIQHLLAGFRPCSKQESIDRLTEIKNAVAELPQLDAESVKEQAKAVLTEALAALEASELTDLSGAAEARTELETQVNAALELAETRDWDAWQAAKRGNRYGWASAPVQDYPTEENQVESVQDFPEAPKDASDS